MYEFVGYFVPYFRMKCADGDRRIRTSDVLKSLSLSPPFHCSTLSCMGKYVERGMYELLHARNSIEIGLLWSSFPNDYGVPHKLKISTIYLLN